MTAKSHRLGTSTGAVRLLVTAGTVAFGSAPLWAGTTLPVPCIAGSCGAGAPSSWVGSGHATATSVGNTLTVQQTSAQATLNWASFNVGANGRVIFNQPNGSSIALNQIFQANPSQIFGLVKANGQIYLINQNGIVFGSTSQVNVGGLLASTLKLTEPDAGLLAPIAGSPPQAALGSPLLGPDGQPLPVQILVQPGAQITTAGTGERIMLAAPSVSNGGTISAPDGQVILAAGQSVFIATSPDSTFRGLVVEVDSGGMVDNQVQGNISVGEGNATLVGLAVNQQGRVSATTSVLQNGSIDLLAQDTVTVFTNSGGTQLLTSNGGALTLGPQSRTQILPDTSAGTAIEAVAQPQSQITLAGKTVELAGGSNITAPDGQVTITASSNPSTGNSS